MELKKMVRLIPEGKVEGNTEVMGRKGRRHKQVLDDLKEMRRYWQLKDEAVTALSGNLAVQDAMDLSQEGIREVCVTGRHLQLWRSCTNLGTCAGF
jgi:hypothetical protein